MDKKIIIPVVISGVVVSVAIGGFISMNSSKKDDTDNTQVNVSLTPTNINSSTTQTPTIEVTQSAKTYKDGTYKSSGSYNSPAGRESIDVELTVKNGKIESVSVTTRGISSTSRQYQNKFKGGISGVIVGKEIKDEYKPSAVSGSSLTPVGFKDAYEQIQKQASS